jgi:hypothetical protein
MTPITPEKKDIVARIVHVIAAKEEIIPAEPESSSECRSCRLALFLPKLWIMMTILWIMMTVLMPVMSKKRRRHRCCCRRRHCIQPSVCVDKQLVAYLWRSPGVGRKGRQYLIRMLVKY